MFWEDFFFFGMLDFFHLSRFLDYKETEVVPECVLCCIFITERCWWVGGLPQLKP